VLVLRWLTFQWTSAGLGAEDTQMIIESMAMAGAEPTFCMGDDTPLPVLSSKPHQLSDYFKQRFAQVYMYEHMLRYHRCYCS